MLLMIKKNVSERQAASGYAKANKKYMKELHILNDGM